MDNNLIQIKEYAKPKKDGGGSGGRITYNINGSDIGSSLKLKSLQANRILSDYIESNTVKAGTGNFVYLVASDGTISTLRGDNLDYSSGHIGELEADSIETDNLTVHETATIKNIFNEYLSSREIVTDFLTVNKAAHFFEVVIDKIRSVGGTIINTATNCVIDYVEPVIENGITTGYKCYWKQTNNEDDYVSNDWLPNDQAISQNCNLVAGVNHDTGTHYYWRLVKSTSNEDTQNGPMFVNFETGEAKHGTYDDEKQIYIAPEYEVTFVPFSETDYIFKYDNGQDNEEGSFPVTVTDWNISGQTIDEEQEDDSWDEENNVLTVTDTLHGLQLIPNNVTETIDGVERQKYPNIRRGHFTFNTSVNTKLNVMIMFDDDTIEYHPTNGPATAYDIEIKNVNNAIVTMIVITSDVVDVWHACHWIVLGNGTGEFDTPSNDYVINGSRVVDWDNIPAKGDNIAQLGYRYQNLDGYANTQAWKDAHKDEVSRASAIIIAAYKTPDNGGIVNGNTIAPILPPSYAQYQNITDFNLSSHRGTYMDATGTYIKGKLVTTSGNEIDITDDGLDINTSYYRLICSENPITKPATSKTVRFTVFYVDNGVGVEMTAAQLSGWKLIGYTTDSSNQNHNFNGDPVSNQNYFNVTINSSDTSIEAKLYDNSTPAVLKDTYVGTILDLADVKDGKDGKYDQWAYKTSTAANIGARPSSGSTYPPSGWQSTPQSISNVDEHIWMITRTVDPNAVNKWGSWSWPAVRIDGIQGQTGADGTDFEFVYKPFAGPQSFGNDANNPAYWKGHQGANNYDKPDYVGPSDGPQGYGNNWYDHPQGVQSDMMYEYMSQRKKENDEWGAFTQPALWSKYGEKGMDGDGYEYIYRLSENDQFTNPNSISKGEIGPQGIANGTETDKTKDDWVPNGWSDDPQGVSSTRGEQQEYVSTRKKTNGQQWGAFSEPALWAQYVPEGVQGPQGPQGNPGLPGGTGPQGETGPQGYNGKDGEYYALVPLREEFAVKLSAEQVGTNAYQNIAGVLYTDVIYAIAHIVGDTITYLNASELANWRLRISSDNTGGYCVQNSTTIVHALDTKNGYTYDALRYQIDNYLSFVRDNGDSNYLNYYYLHKNNLTAYMPTRLNIALEYHYDINKEAAWALKDSNTVNLEFKPSHIFSVTETALNSIYQGLSGDTNSSWSATGFSAIKQTWDQINLGVNNIRSLENGLQLVNTDTEQYALYKTESTNEPSAPSVVNATDGINKWTSNLSISPDNTYKYEWISTRTRSYSVSTGAGAYGKWSSWSDPKLYWVNGEDRSTTVNSAQLNIEADKIESNVKSSIKTGGTNLIMNGAFKKDLEFWNENGTDTEVTRGIETDSAGYKWSYIQASSGQQYTGYNQSRYSNNKIIINPGKTYTLTFRAYAAKGTPELSTIFHWGNHILTDAYRQEHNLGIPQIGKKHQLSTSPQSYTWSFTIPDNLFNTGVGAEWFTFIFNDETGQNIKMYITDITFVEGDTPQYWSPSPEEEEEYTESSITQTANNIKLEVKNGLNSTGINIDTHNITLNADKTTINGNLNLYDNNNNGITIYDANNIPRVNLQADPIGNISQMSNDTYTTISKYSTNGIGFNKTIRTDSFLVDANKVIDVSGITISAYSSSGDDTLNYATSNYATLKIDILDSDSEIVATKTVNIYRINEQGTYITSEALNCLTSAYGNYSVEFKITNMSGSYSGTAYVYAYAVIQTSSIVQTFIGQDGMYSHISSNKMYWINEDEIQMRMGFNGLRLINAPNSARYGHINTICGVYGTQPNLKPVWIPFYNYTPMFNPVFKTTTETITNTGDTGKYVYRINPFNDYGICYITDAIFKDFDGDDNHWILLPNGSTTYPVINGTTIVNLPAGYTITIINYSHNTVYVSVDVSSRGTGIIRDFNGDNNRWCSLKPNSRYDTYIYTGYNNEWIALHDTQ